MGKLYEALDDRLIAFINAQKLFFVATAPLSGEGHVNVSPKGYNSFAVLDPLTIAYLDMGGSGIETVAHLYENQRITFMFCAFEGPANILRLYGKGSVTKFDDPDFPTLLTRFPDFERARNIITVKLERIADSCGWGVPFYEFVGEREQLKRHADNPKMTPEAWSDKYYTKNANSIDGLPGLQKP